MRLLLIGTLCVLLVASCALSENKIPDMPPLPQPGYKPQKSDLLDKAIEEFVTGDLQAALENAEKVIAEDPLNPTANEIISWSAELEGRDGEKFEALLRRLRVADDNVELAVVQAFSNDLSRIDVIRLASVFSVLLESDRLPEPARARVVSVLSSLYRRLDKLEKAKRLTDSLGYIGGYWVIASFDNSQNSGFNKAFQPEKEFDPSEKYQGKEWKIGWRWIDTKDFDGKIRFSNHFDPFEWSIAYAYAAIEVPQEMNAVLRISVDDHIKLWLNGEMVLSDDTSRFSAIDQYVVPVKFKRGENQILVKVAQRTGDWSLGIRVTNPDGSPIAGIRYPEKPLTPYPPAQPQKENSQQAGFEYTRGVGLYKATADDTALSLLRKSYWLLTSGFRRPAIDTLEETIRQYPKFSYARYLLGTAYEEEGNPTRSVEAYQALLDDNDNKLPMIEQIMVDYYMRNNQEDKGYQLLQSLLERNPSFIPARKGLIAYYQRKGFLELALAEAQKLTEEFPNCSSIVTILADANADMGYNREAEALYKKVLSLDYLSGKARDNLIQYALENRNEEEAIGLLKDYIKLYPYQINRQLRIVEIYLSLHELEKAESILSTLLEITPEYHRIYQLKGIIAMRRGDEKTAVEYFKRAVELNPSNTSLREYAEFLSPKSKSEIADFKYPREEIEQMVKSALHQQNHPEDMAYIILDYGVNRIFPNGSSVEYAHQVIKINTDAGKRRYSRYRLPNSYDIKIHRAVTYTPDGRAIEATNIKNGEIYFPMLAPGTIIEVEYEWNRYSGGWLEEHYTSSFYFQDEIPVELSRWVVIAPKDKKLLHDETNPIIQFKMQDYKDNLIQYEWVAKDVPRIEEEANRPPLFNLIARTDISTIPDWEVLARWMNSLVNDQTAINNDIRKKVEELTKDKKTKLEKLIAIYDFIVTDIRYLFADEGIMGKKPDLPANVFANRFGDCKDKTLLMIAMLKEVGISSRYAELRTRNEGTMPIKTPMAATNHAIVYVPKQDGIEEDLFLDGTAENFSYKALPFIDQGITAIVLNGETYEFKETPLLEPDQSFITGNYTYELKDNGDADVALKLVFTGSSAARARGYYKDEATRKKRLENFFSLDFKGADIKEYNIEGLNDIENPIEITATLTVPRFARKENNSIAFKLAQASELSRMFTKAPTRKYPLVIGERGLLKATHVIKLPEKYKLETTPEEKALKAKNYYEFNQHVSQNNQKEIIIERNHLQNAVEIPVEDYAMFREFNLDVDKTEQIELRAIIESTVPKKPSKK